MKKFLKKSNADIVVFFFGLIVLIIALLFTLHIMKTKAEQLEKEREVLQNELLVQQDLIIQTAETSQALLQQAKAIQAEIKSLRQEIARTLILDRILKVNKKAQASRITSAILSASETYDIPAMVLTAIIEQESTYNDRAVGKAGERCLMQISKSTANDLEVDWNKIYHIETCINAGAKYLSQHFATYKGNTSRAVYRYNGGGDPKYVQRIQNKLSQLGE